MLNEIINLRKIYKQLNFMTKNIMLLLCGTLCAQYAFSQNSISLANSDVIARNIEKPMSHDHTAMNYSATDIPVVKAVRSAEDAAKHVTTMPASWKGVVDKTIALGTLPGLKFDASAITVKAGSKVKLTFKNTDVMPHNFVLTDVDAGTEVGQLALKLGAKGAEMDYVPSTPKVLEYTSIIDPQKSETIYFNAPSKPGSYPFICSFPGHYIIMKGVITVTQ